MNKENARDYLPLVQALAEGRVIQHQKTDGTWIDDIEFSFDWPAHRYRVKREAREVWFIDYFDGSHAGPFVSGFQASTYGNPGGKAVLYREVIE